MNSRPEPFSERYRQLCSEGKTGWVDRESEGWTVHLSCLEKALSHPECPRDGRALDFGCGAGCWSVELARRGFDVTAVDQSPEAIEWAIQKAREAEVQIDFRRQNVVECDNLEAETFGFVLDGFCFHCLVNASDRNTYLRTAYRILKDGGVFFLQAFFDDDLQRRVDNGHTIDLERRLTLNNDGTPSRYIGTSNDIRDAVLASGFAIVDDYSIPWANGMLMLLATKTRTLDSGPDK